MAINLNLEELTEKAKKLTSSVGTTVADKNTRNEMFKKICSIIPNKIDNDTIISAFELMRKQQLVLKKDFSARIAKNELAFKNHEDVLKNNGGLIEDQNAWKDVSFGESTMMYSGCEIFATFNAIRGILGKDIMSLPKMINSYEKDGMVMSGKFGTAPKAIADFLNKNGFKTKMTTESGEFDAMGKTSDGLILTMYNDGNDISQEVHTVNISKNAGKFTAHNVYCNGKVVGPYNSVSEVIKNINGGKAKGISLIGINKM